MWARAIQQTTNSSWRNINALDAMSLVKAMSATDAAAFPRAVISFLQPEMQVDHCAVFVFRNGIAPALAYEASISTGTSLPSDASTNYMLGHYRSDGLSRFIDTLDRRSETELLAFEQSNDDIRDLSYKQHCYQRCRVIDRLSVVTPVFDRPASTPSWLSINLYRVLGAKPFSLQELHDAQGLLSVAVATVKTRHVLRGSNAETPNRSPTNGVLSPREAQVADLVAGGYSSKEIAAKLGILSSTVTTLRKRAYDKLGVANGKGLAAAWTVR